MTLQSFSGVIAVDSSGQLAVNAPGLIYAKSDVGLTTPLAAQDANGLPLDLTTSSLGKLPDFQVDTTDPAVWWKSGSLPPILIASIDSILAAITSAQTSSASAQTAATVAQGSAATSATAAITAQAAAEAAATAAASVLPAGGAAGQVLAKNSSASGDYIWTNYSSGGGSGGGFDGVHGHLSGLDADDHLQYLTNARGDVRYYPRSTVDTMVNNAASANSAADRLRTNHTGTQAISTITGLQTILDGLGGSAVTSVAGKTGAVTLVANDISDATTYGKQVMGAASAAAARTAIGAGTSSLALGASSTTALRGNAIVLNPASTAGLADGTLIARTA